MEVMISLPGMESGNPPSLFLVPQPNKSSKIDEVEDLSNFQRFSEKKISQPVPAINYSVMKCFPLAQISCLIRNQHCIEISLVIHFEI